jgi:hypothetical protein
MAQAWAEVPMPQRLGELVEACALQGGTPASSGNYATYGLMLGVERKGDVFSSHAFSNQRAP